MQEEVSFLFRHLKNGGGGGSPAYAHEVKPILFRILLKIADFEGSLS